MFEPLPGLVRLRREQRNLTQERLAKMANVSRGQLIAFEKGEQNVTLHFLLKIARALEMRELPLAELHFRPAAPDVTVLITATTAIATAERLVTEVMGSLAGSADQVREASAAVKAALERALAADGLAPEIAAAAERLASTPPDRQAALAKTVRDVVEERSGPPRSADSAREAKPAARKRVR